MSASHSVRLCATFHRARCAGLTVAAAVIIVDVLTKALALVHLEAAPTPIIEGFFNLRLAFNRGVSFSMLAESGVAALPWFLSALAVAVSAYFVYWMKPHASRLVLTGLGLLVGGALGNMVDRLRFGHVVDFLDFYWQHWHFPAFNVADAAISTGLGLILLDAFLDYLNKGKKQDA